MHAELTRFLVGEKTLERHAHSSEREVFPGDFVLVKESGLDRLMARVELGREQASSVKEVDLACSDDVDDAVEPQHFDACAGLFIGFTDCAFLGCLPQFHETGWQGPISLSGFDVSLAQQHLIAPHRQGADHIQWVDVVDVMASRANRAHSVVVGRNLVLHRGATGLAVLDFA